MRASRPDVSAPSRRETWRALAVLLMTVALCGEAAAAPAKSEPAAKPAATAPAKNPTATAAKTATPTTKTTTAPAKPAVAAVPKAKAPAATGTSAQAASTRPSAVTPVRSTTKGVAPSTLPSLEQQVTYQYNALGRRDPFMAMAGGTFIGDDLGGDAPPDVGGLKIVGIVWGASDKFALVEDARGSSRVLRAGDPVMNGVVETLKRDAVVVKLTVDGQTETVAIPLTRKGDQTNGNR